MVLNTPLKKSIWSMISHRGIDTNLNRHVRANGEVCFWCGARLVAGDIEADHVMPKSKAGADRLANLVPSCTQCNRKKGGKDPLAFATEIGKSADEVKVILAHRSESKSSKRATVFHLMKFGVDAYVFRGFDQALIEDGRNIAGIHLHVLLQNYRALTAAPNDSKFMADLFAEHGYDLIDRRG